MHVAGDLVIALVRVEAGLLALATALVTIPRPMRAQADAPAPVRPVPCTTGVFRAALPDAKGAQIRSVRIQTHPPTPFRGPARLLNRLHARTRAATIRRELLFAAGGRADSLRIAESLRRLRALGYLDDAWLTATRCAATLPATVDDARVEGRVRGHDPTLDLVVETRDAWSTLPDAYWSATQQTLGVYEMNLLGTGRAASAVLRWDTERLGGGYRFGGQLGLADPALTPRLAASASVAAFGDGHAWAVAAATRARTLADRWTGRAALSQSLRDPANRIDDHVRRDRAGALFGRRLSPEAAPTAIYLLGGVEAERTAVEAGIGTAVVGPAAVRRSFVAPDIGLALRAVRFDTLTWLLPRGGIVDVPRGIETELVAGAGRDGDGGLLGHLTGRVGRVWRPRPDALVATDAWTSGYLRRSVPVDGRRLQAAVLRVSVLWLRSTGDGLWTARVGAERLVEPDPDTRAFTGLDPTALLVPGAVRLSETTATASVERSTHLRSITRSFVLDAALFGAASQRRHPASAVAGDRVDLGVVGVGLRLAPTRAGPPTVGIDLGYPVLRPATVRRGPALRVTLTPWFGALRAR